MNGDTSDEKSISFPEKASNIPLEESTTTPTDTTDSLIGAGGENGVVETMETLALESKKVVLNMDIWATGFEWVPKQGAFQIMTLIDGRT